MKKTVLSRRRAAALAWVLTAMPAGSVFAGEYAIPAAKVGVVRIETVFNAYQYVVDRRAEIDVKYKGAREKIENMERNIENETRKLQGDPLTRPGTPEYERRQMEVQLLISTMELERRKYARDINKENAEVFIKFYDAFRNACLQACRYYSVDILLTATDPNLPEEARQADVPVPALRQDILMRIVQYSANAIDVTAGVTQILNNTYAGNKTNPSMMFPARPPGMDTWTPQSAAAPAMR